MKFGDVFARITSNFAKPIFKIKTIFFQKKIKKSASDRHSDVIIDTKKHKLMAKCTIQVQTRDLRFRISSNFAKLIFKMSITMFVQNECKNLLLTVTVTSSFTSKMTKSVVKCIIQVQIRDLIVRITSNFGSITLHTKLIDSWKTVHQILFLTTAVTSLFT